MAAKENSNQRHRLRFRPSLMVTGVTCVSAIATRFTLHRSKTAALRTGHPGWLYAPTLLSAKRATLSSTSEAAPETPIAPTNSPCR